MLIVAGLVLATLAVYLQTLGFGFVSWDDPFYVQTNPHVKNGLNLSDIKWAFSSKPWGLWTPLLWVSFMLDASLGGINPAVFHATDLILHICNTLLLFFLLVRATKLKWHAAVVAGLFALHPLHVESVAWITERKDTLSTFFWMVASLAYVVYTERPSVWKYCVVALTFAMALMSKPMVVTLPIVFLLMDYWPLERLAMKGEEREKGGLKFRALLLEKLPLFVMSGIAIKIMLLPIPETQAPLVPLPFASRIATAVVGYAFLLQKMVWPSGLAAIYPHPGKLPLLNVISSALILTLLTGLAVLLGRRYRWFITGWLWYLVTLGPVSGIKEFGPRLLQADRYSYVPLIGVFIVVVWGIAALAEKAGAKQGCISTAHIYLGISTIFVLGLFAAISWRQVGYWKDSVTLYERALSVTSGNYIVYNNLAACLSEQGQLDKAEALLREALKINPNYEASHYGLGLVLMKTGRIEEAIRHFKQAVKIWPKYSSAHFGLGQALEKLNRLDEALISYKNAVESAPENVLARNAAGVILMRQGRLAEAVEWFRKALAIVPTDPYAQCNLGAALERQGKREEALKQLKEAVRLSPDFPEGHYNLGTLLMNMGKLEEAVSHLSRAIALKPDYLEARQNLALALWKQRDLEGAAYEYRQCIKISPNNAEFHSNLGIVLEQQKKFQEAIAEYKLALSYDPDLTAARSGLERLSVVINQ